MDKRKKNIITALLLVAFMLFLFLLTFYNIGIYNRIAIKLKMNSNKNNVMHECEHLFHNPELADKLDENKYLLGFENGVYDLKLHKFREGHTDDYISLSTKVEYIKWNENNPISKQILKFFQQIIPNEKVREYFLTILSTCLSGDNEQEKIYFANYKPKKIFIYGFN